MPHGLSQETIHLMVQTIKAHKEIEKIVLFGSRAKGTYKNGSDIDLCLFGENLSLSLIHTIENELDDLLLPYTIDLIIYDSIKSEELISHINRIGITL